MKAVKCIAPLIINELTNCVNNNLEHGIFPESLKSAKITPIHKTGNKQDPGNYRPISVLPAVSKIFEKVIHRRLDNFLTTNQILTKKQYGFRAKANTLAATVDLTTHIKHKIDQRQIVLGVFIDLRKAFDTISHDILLVNYMILE